MKKRIIAWMLAGVFGFSLTACSMEEAKNAIEKIDAKEIFSAFENAAAEAKEDEPIIIPDAVKNISPELDQAVTGVLTEDSYTNEYFGLKVHKIEDGIIYSLMDDGVDLTPLSETFANNMGYIIIMADSADDLSHISMYITAVREAKSEEELVQEKYDFEKAVNETLGYEAELSIGSVFILGEEHPAVIEVTGDGNEKWKRASIFLIKGDFECDISFSGPMDKFDEMIGYFEEI